MGKKEEEVNRTPQYVTLASIYGLVTTLPVSTFEGAS
jgi:hypothetical protein